MTQNRKTALSVCCIASLLGTMASFPLSSANAAEQGSIVINEVCAKNTEFAAPDGNFYDYIELYNSSISADTDFQTMQKSLISLNSVTAR